MLVFVAVVVSSHQLFSMFSLCLFVFCLEAVRIKYRLSEDAYQRYYTNVLRIKLSRCLYDEGRRKGYRSSSQRNMWATDREQVITAVPLPPISTESSISIFQDNLLGFD
jgi:hypothetical protein